MDVSRLALPLHPDRLSQVVDSVERRHAAHADAASILEDWAPCGCLVELASLAHPSVMLPLAGLDDEEGAHVPTELDAPIVDAHVHVFPDPVFEALWRWFERFGWPVRYRLTTPMLLDHLFTRGISKVVALHYGHKPGISRSLNRYVAELARTDPRVIGLGTVLPGEPDAIAIVEEVAAAGLSGIKLHCHVQAFSPDSDDAMPIFAACERLGLAVVLHAGRLPRSSAYPIDPLLLCGVERVERVVEAFPALRLAIPHLGADEVDGYTRLLERTDNVVLDTTMMLAGYFPGDYFDALARCRPDRVMYGTDFPNLPYSWDRELRAIAERRLGETHVRALLGDVARWFFRA
jgi:predicted TIM-barrel fold metal-dependent hydrolase